MALPDPDLSRGVLIGTSDFERLPHLPAVRNNLTQLSQVLTDPDTGILTWQNCSVVDSPDSPMSFMSRLRRAAEQAEDLLLVYYAGHGIRHDTKEMLYLTVRATDPEAPTVSAVSFELVKEVIEQSPARTRLLILDCCYSGLALGSMSAEAIGPREIEVSGTSVITSSPRNTISHSPPGERYTAFTGELLRLLKDGPRLADEQLTVQQLYRSLRTGLANRGLPQPKLAAGDTSGDLLLRKSTHAASPRLAPPTVPTPQPVPTPRPATVDDRPPQPLPPMTPLAGNVRQSPSEQRERTRPDARLGAAFALWALFVLLSGFGIGGLIGSVFGTPVTGHASVEDLQVAIPMVVFAAAVGYLLHRIRLKLRAPLGRMPLIEDPLPALRRAVRPTLIVLIVLLGAGFVAGITSPPPTPSGSATGLSIQATGLVILGELVIACGYGLYRRRG